MKLYNTENISWVEILESLWLVSGNVVQSKNIWTDIFSGLKSIFGWEIWGYSKMLEESRNISTQRMIQEARRLWADAIVNIRYSSSAISQWMSEILVYGTAVKIKK